MPHDAGETRPPPSSARTPPTPTRRSRPVLSQNPPPPSDGLQTVTGSFHLTKLIPHRTRELPEHGLALQPDHRARRQAQSLLHPRPHRRRQPDRTHTRTLVALTIGTLITHGSHSTEHGGLGEGPVPSPIQRDCASLSEQPRTTPQAPDPPYTRTVTAPARAVRSFSSLVKGSALRALQAGPTSRSAPGGPAPRRGHGPLVMRNRPQSGPRFTLRNTAVSVSSQAPGNVLRRASLVTPSRPDVTSGRGYAVT